MLKNFLHSGSLQKDYRITKAYQTLMCFSKMIIISFVP